MLVLKSNGGSAGYSQMLLHALIDVGGNKSIHGGKEMGAHNLATLMHVEMLREGQHVRPTMKC